MKQTTMVHLRDDTPVELRQDGSHVSISFGEYGDVVLFVAVDKLDELLTGLRHDLDVIQAQGQLSTPAGWVA